MPPTPRTVKNALTKLLDRIVDPVYVLGQQREIVYVNEAFLTWTGWPLEETIGVRCIYCSQTLDDPLEERCRGLAPIPDADHRTSHPVAIGPQVERTYRGRFIALAFEDQGDAIDSLLCIVDLQSSPHDEESAKDENAIDEAGFGLLKLLESRWSRWHHPESLVGESPFARRLRQQVDAAATSDANVLIVGPVGSGRAHLASVIWQQRHQRRRLLVQPLGDGEDPHRRAIAGPRIIEGRSADPEQVASVLEQAIADATTQRTAKTPTVAARVVLRDLDLLDVSAQAELVHRMESSPMEVRIIATANADVFAEAQAGRLHPALAWAVSTTVIETVALRDRAPDVLAIAQWLLIRDNANRTQQIGGFDSSVRQMLADYHWPGNIAELHQVIDDAALECGGPKICVEHLPKSFVAAWHAMQAGHAETPSIDLEGYLLRIEKELVQRAMKAADGNKAQAARWLGISRARLLRRLEQFEMATLSKEKPSKPEKDSLTPKSSSEPRAVAPTNDAVVKFEPVETPDADETEQGDGPVFEEADES